MTKQEWKNIWEIATSALLAYLILVIIINVIKAYIYS